MTFGSGGRPHLGISFRVDDLEDAEQARLRAMLEIAESVGISRIAIGDGHVPQVGVTVHHPYQLLAGSLQQHLLA